VPRYFVIWCLETSVEEVIDAAGRHGVPVGPIKLERHITGQVSGSTEIEREVADAEAS
jgi:hypothetical protein